ncbi:motile sperm domain-containing protein 2 isoform X3 [Rhineura floridana]|uniref:motile sperm domain-containing protein 2 isoform X3 n=1 Tax=Rhineura floridana TaxID=261503 RepID=UPI002AC85F04|nr:motile sperm domain-containing protein 2 isoform X3 [Rhineura floridana]
MLKERAGFDSCEAGAECDARARRWLVSGLTSTCVTRSSFSFTPAFHSRCCSLIRFPCSVAAVAKSGAGRTMADQDTRSALISETRRRFEAECIPVKMDKYDPRDVERLQQDDTWIDNFLIWHHDVMDDTLKMIDESFQWRKEYAVHDLSESSLPKWMFDTGIVYLHGYDKEGYKMFWFRAKLHTKDPKTQFEKKKLVAFWLERYARREHGKPLTMVFDMAETGLSNIDLDFVRYIVTCFKVYYPNYLTKIVIFELPWIMNAAFKLVKSWLGPEAVNLLKVTNKNEVQEYISAEYLPPHMGGTDTFKYSYPPLVDDDFQTPLCENGPITSEDETETKEEIDMENKESLDSNEEQAPNSKKANFTEQPPKSEEYEKQDSKTKNAKKALTTFKGPLLHISPAEELHFGSKETGEKKCLIVLTNVTKNTVAFKVRTTAPDKYRVKPSNSSCEPGTSLDIIVSLHGGCAASLQDRFLIMAAEMEQYSGAGTQELAQFWKEVPRSKVMEHRLRCHVIESSKPSTLTINENAFNIPAKTNEDLHLQLTQLLQANKRLREQIDRCVWFQQLTLLFMLLLVASTAFCFYLLYAPRRYCFSLKDCLHGSHICSIRKVLLQVI